MTSISVIVPCRDGEAFLGPTLESVLQQTRPPEEVVVVDNGSTDGSRAIAESYAESYQDIVRVVSNPEGNAAAARAHGVELASGEALMFLDADDLLGPTALEHLAAVLDRAPEAVACCPWFRLEEEDGCWHTAPPSCAPRRAGQDDLAAWLTGWYQPPCSVLWSRRAYERSGGWDPEVRVNQDGDVMMRGFVAGNRLAFATHGAAYYRRPPGDRVSLSGTRTTRAGVAARLDVLRRIAARLEAQGRMARYRGPLGEAFAALLTDGADAHPELYSACLAEVRRHAGPEWLRRVRRLPARCARKAAHLRRKAHLAVAPPASDPSTDASPPPRPAAIEDDGPLVSVVIPTYNRARLLRRALDSVFAQSYPHYEVLVVDDASTDDTAEMIAGYEDPRLRYLVQPENGGVGAARNRGMRESSGSLIAFLDSDDEWMPEKLARQVALFEASPPSVGLVYSGVEMVDSKGWWHVARPNHRGLLHQRMLLSNFIVGGSCAMIRRRVVDTVGEIDEQLPAIEDYDFWLRISRFFRIDFVPEPLTRYHDDVSGEHAAERRSRSFIANFHARQMFYERNRHEMAWAGVEHLFLLESAKRHLKWPYGDSATGRRLALRAVARRPTAPELYPWLTYALLDERTRPLAAALARRIGSLGEFGRRMTASGRYG